MGEKMAFYAGFDTKDYPGIDTMNWLSANSNLKWCGYYLAPAPNRSPTGWPGQYNSLAAGWGVVPIYVGQQDPRTGNANYTPSSILTSDQGTIDGKNAADLVATEQFASGSFVFLDWEYGSLDAEGSGAYIQAWITALAADGRFMPGIYCSHVVAPNVVPLIDNINPTPVVRFWCWKVPTTDQHAFTGDLANIPELDPSGCGFAGADGWQREQNATVSFPAGAPIASLGVDFSTASRTNPATPLATDRVA
jgi:hypothetical protein